MKFVEAKQCRVAVAEISLEESLALLDFFENSRYGSIMPVTYWLEVEVYLKREYPDFDIHSVFPEDLHEYDLLELRWL